MDPASHRDAQPDGSLLAWGVLTAVFVSLTFTSGLCFYNQSVLLEAITSQRGLPVREASLAATIFFIMSSLTGLGVALFIERYDPRWVVAAGALVASAALVAIGRINNLPQLYLAFALFGVGFAGCNMIVGTTLIAHWFVQRRALALAIASTGLSVGGMVVTPFAARAIGTDLSRGTLLCAVWLTLGIVPIALILMRPGPRSDVDRHGTTAHAKDALRRALRSRFFILISLAYLFGLAGQVGGLSHQFKLITERSDTGAAAMAVSLLAGASVVGRLLAGGLTTRFDPRALALVLTLAQGGALLLLGSALSVPGLLASSATLGLTVGSFLLMQPLLISNTYGTAKYARLFSISGLIGGVGVALGPLLVGWVHDVAGGYRLGFAAAALFSLLAAGCLLGAGRPVGGRGIGTVPETGRI